MTFEVAYVPELVGSNYLAWKRNMIDVLRSKHQWRIVKEANQNQPMHKT